MSLSVRAASPPRRSELVASAAVASAPPTLTSFPYTRVGLKNEEGNYSVRATIRVHEGWKPYDLSERYSLLIPEYLSDRPRLVQVEPSAAAAASPRKQEDWSQVRQVVRYFGLVDLDMDLAGLVKRKQPFQLQGTNHLLSSAREGKQLWSAFLKQHAHWTLAQLADACPLFAEVSRDAWQLAEALERCATVQKGSVLVYFTGCRGFRLLWLDPTLAYPVQPGTAYHTDFLRTVAPDYFHTKLALPGFVSKLDASIYEPNKGSKPDLSRHLTSGLVTVRVDHQYGQDAWWGSTPMVEAASQDHVAEGLTDKISLFWRSVPSLLTPANLQGKRRLGESTQQPSAQGCGSSGGRGRAASSSSSSSSSHAAAAAAASAASAGALVSIRSNQEAWSGLQESELQVKGMGGAAAADGPNSCVTLTAPSLRYCAIIRREHSKPGKIYFVLHTATGRLTQRCHSQSCSQEHVIVDAAAASSAVPVKKRRRPEESKDGWEMVDEAQDEDAAEVSPSEAKQLRRSVAAAAAESDDWNALLRPEAEAEEEMSFDRLEQAERAWNTSSTTRALVEALQGDRQEEDVQAFQQERGTFLSALMRYLNQFWAIVTTPSKPVYVDRVRVARSGGGGGGGSALRTELVMRGKDAFHEVYANRRLTLWTYDGQSRSVTQQTKPLSVWWIHSPLRKQYDKMECDPSPAASPRNLNLWHGFALTAQHAAVYRQTHPDYQAEAQPFLDHIRQIWCQGNEACFRYVMGWLAMTLQRPQEKIGVALVVVGQPGAGKGVVVTDFLARIVGDRHYAHVMGIEQLLGRFNASTTLANKLMLVDECTWAGRKEDANRLKAIITEPTITVEKKYMDSMEVPSLSNLLFFSNDLFAVHVDRKDRRFCSLETDNRYSGTQNPESRAYFDRLRAVPVEAVAAVLYGWDLTGFHARSFPHTAFRQAQQIEGFVANSVEKWFLERLERERLLCFEATPDLGWEGERRKELVYADYKDQAGAHPKASAVFWRELSAMGVCTTRQVRIVGQPSVQLVRFEPWLVCRAAFSQAMAGDQSWRFETAAVDAAVDAERPQNQHQ